MANPNADNSMAPGDTGIHAPPAISSANLDSAKGCFSGGAVVYRLPCTAGEDRTCQIATHLSTWNEILCYVGLEAKFVKKLIVVSKDNAASEKVSVAISGLPWLEHLELTMGECPEDVPAALSQLLRTTTSLSTLQIAGLRMKGKYAKAFFTALRRNNTLTKLSLQGFALRDVDCQVSFARYLHRSTTLTSLTVEARGRTGKCLKSVLRGLRNNRSVLSLTLIDFVFDEGSARHAAILLSENKTLRSFKIKDSSGMGEEGPPSLYDCWLPAVIENETLEELHLPMRYWQPEKWDEVFAVLPHKATLTKVFVEIDLEYPELQRVCLALRESEAVEKVTLTVRYFPLSLDLLEFMEYSEICVDGCCCEKNAALILNRLLRIDIITTVHMIIQRGDFTLSLALANYVATTTILRSLYIEVHELTERVAVDIASNWWTVILESLAVNKSIRDLALEKSRNMDDRDLEGLADVVRKSRNVTSVFVAGDISAFVQRMAVGIRDNYTLLGVSFNDRVYPEVAKDWFAVRDTANRNWDVVTRAALFASGRRDDRYHVAALERVYKHRVLLEELADVLHIDEADVAVEARKWLAPIDGLQGFMRYAGVVKERVEFHPSQDGSAQLDVLNDDCWRLVKRYLMLDDVKDPSELPLQHYNGPDIS
ncbi:hypothetical protein HPB52_016933 [Rhipicephalus sanguineus]|uniref:Nlr family card domain protein n=1 Tax=Rhipicephalus sanguineus TaxID=34632 RepID=A0A9D4PJ61_RHISA|nr:hypothetical protein HPB52_016933 [Rhipicephalus sanguineus]